MIKCISEQVMRNEFNFFREMGNGNFPEELDEATDEDEYS
jgi:hypothetical protein